MHQGARGLTKFDEEIVSDMNIWRICKELHKLPSEVKSEPNRNIELMQMIIGEER